MLEPVTTKVLGHGGAAAAYPSNTIEAFREAARVGADGTELDVRRSRDHALVVHHDAHLRDGRLIAETDVADLPNHVPLLGEVLDALQGLFVNIEIKNFPTEPDFDPEHYLSQAVAALVAERDLYGSVVVSCFNLHVIDRVAEEDGRIRCGYLMSSPLDPRQALAATIEHGHAAFHPHHSVVDAELVEEAHGAGIDVNVWTVNEPDRIRWLGDIGVDAVITDVPDVALDALRRRPPA